MNKLIALVIAVVLSMTVALAESAAVPEFLIPDFSEESPAPETSPAPEATIAPQSANGMIASLYGYTLPFVLDDDPSYSFCDEGIIQADFYCETQNAAYDLFLMFPESVESGDVLTPENAAQWGSEETCVILRTTTERGENYAFALFYDAQPYPYGSQFTIQFDSVERDEATFRASGAFSARLAPDFAPTSGGMIEISGSFDFSINLDDSLMEEDASGGMRALHCAI